MMFFTVIVEAKESQISLGKMSIVTTCMGWLCTHSWIMKERIRLNGLKTDLSRGCGKWLVCGGRAYRWMSSLFSSASGRCSAQCAHHITRHTGFSVTCLVKCFFMKLFLICLIDSIQPFDGRRKLTSWAFWLYDMLRILCSNLNICNLPRHPGL